MYNLIMQLKDADPYTRAEAKRAIGRVLDEAAKIRGHIAGNGAAQVV